MPAVARASCAGAGANKYSCADSDTRYDNRTHCADLDGWSEWNADPHGYGDTDKYGHADGNHDANGNDPDRDTYEDGHPHADGHENIDEYDANSYANIWDDHCAYRANNDAEALSNDYPDRRATDGNQNPHAYLVLWRLHARG